MGLEGQHPLQHALLARCSCYQVAAAVVYAAGAVLNVQYRPSGVSSFAPDSEVQSEARVKWDELISGLEIDQASERPGLADVYRSYLPAKNATPVFESAAFFFRATLGTEMSKQLRVISRHADERFRMSV